VENAVAVRPWPVCEALLNLKEPLRAPRRPTLSIVGGKPAREDARGRPVASDAVVLKVANPFSIRIAASDVPSYLYAFYIEDDKTVVNLILRRGPMRRQTMPGEQVVLGDGQQGRATFRATRPKGEGHEAARPRHLLPRLCQERPRRGAAGPSFPVAASEHHAAARRAQHAAARGLGGGRAHQDRGMSVMFATAWRSVLAASLGLALLVPAALAQSVDAEAIVRALTPKPKPPTTRSFKAGGERGIDIQGGEGPEEPAPSIDLYVHFEFDQSALTMSDARIAVDALGKALKDTRLASMSFEIIGHTDARGTDEYNLKLSRDRADAVRSRLIQFHGVDPSRLKAEGRGKRELKDPAHPEHELNRRVQIRTVPDKTS